jgi:hypothetical protein
MLRKNVIVAAAMIGGCCTAVTAAAQAPAMQTGIFEVGAPAQCGGHSWCNSVGSEAMRNEGLSVSPGNPSYGQGQDATVMVLCTPSGANSSAVVVASSLNGPTAERLRNAVRTRMVREGCL